MSIAQKHFTNGTASYYARVHRAEIADFLYMYEQTLHMIAKNADERARRFKVRKASYKSAGIEADVFDRIDEGYQEVATYFNELFNAAAEGRSVEFDNLIGRVGQAMKFTTWANEQYDIAAAQMIFGVTGEVYDGPPLHKRPAQTVLQKLAVAKR